MASGGVQSWMWMSWAVKKNNNNRILVIGQVIDAPKTEFVSYLSTGNEVDWAGSEGSLVTRRVPDELFVMWFLLGEKVGSVA